MHGARVPFEPPQFLAGYRLKKVNRLVAAAGKLFTILRERQPALAVLDGETEPAVRDVPHVERILSRHSGQALPVRRKGEPVKRLFSPAWIPRRQVGGFVVA